MISIDTVPCSWDIRSPLIGAEPGYLGGGGPF
jgi:hypothetical protein